MPIEHSLTLNARETYPLARALVFYRGDRQSSVLHLSFCDGDTPIGEDSGCSATLQVLFEGAQDAVTYLLVKESEGGYSIALTAPLLACAGVARCTATVYDENGVRLTVGRFTYTVLEDDSLPADYSLSEAQVGLMQQALSSIALAYDQVGELQEILGEDKSYAREMGDFAKEWGTAAKNAVQNVSVTWYTLPGKPNAFTPAAHTHAEFAQIQAAIPDERRLLSLREAPDSAQSALSAVQALIAGGELCGFLWVSAYEDLPAVSGLLLYFAKATGAFKALFTDGANLYARSGLTSGWSGDWTQFAAVS